LELLICVDFNQIVSEAVVVETRRTGRMEHLPSRGRALSKQPAAEAFAGAAGGEQRRGTSLLVQKIQF